MQINVLEYFEQGALAKCREKVAVLDQGRRYTFAELERFAKNCAALVLQRTGAINQPIAVFLPKCAETVIADLGILYSGNCYANLDVKSPPERLKAILKNLGASIIMISAVHAAALRAVGTYQKQLLLVEAAMLSAQRHRSVARLLPTAQRLPGDARRASPKNPRLEVP
jgi:acyl-CoA synthetase (AMP-forming)/AMP-acid ligase II